MKVITGTIKLDSKQFSATMIDFDSYEVVTGTIKINGKEYKSQQVIGKEGFPNLICSNRLLCSESAII